MVTYIASSHLKVGVRLSMVVSVDGCERKTPVISVQVLCRTCKVTVPACFILGCLQCQVGACRPLSKRSYKQSTKLHQDHISRKVPRDALRMTLRGGSQQSYIIMKPYGSVWRRGHARAGCSLIASTSVTEAHQIRYTQCHVHIT